MTAPTGTTKFTDVDVEGAFYVNGVAVNPSATTAVVAGTATASKAVVLDANKAVDVVRTASLRLGASGSEVAVTSTAAQINAAANADAIKTYKYVYDFAVQGGAVGTKILTAGALGQIPDNFIIGNYNVTLEAITTLTSGGLATLSIGLTENVDAFIAATAFSEAGVFGAGAIAELDAETALKTTQVNDIVAVIAGAAITAGKFTVWVNGLQGS